MEITSLIQATDDAFKTIENAREEAMEILDKAVYSTTLVKDMKEIEIQSVLKGTLKTKSKLQNFIATFILLFAFWILLSGRFDTFHLSLGAICSILIAWVCYDLIFVNIKVGDYWLEVGRFLVYIPWLLYQVVKANIYVASLTLNPKPSIDPQIVRFKTKLETDISCVTLANSITLTPGTITMDIKEGEFYVHALDKKVAEDLGSGEMEDWVAHIFMEADHIYIQDVLDVARIYRAIR